MGEENRTPAAKKKKGTISEDDVFMLLQRYSAEKILALLQEVSQSAHVKIDWKELVKRTSTGITSAREYQMLWRHLAYRDTLLEKLEDGAEPLDDDSDLDFEVEAVPVISSEASIEAAACVKVLISSGVQRETCPTSHLTVEVPLTINIPNGHSSCVLPDKLQPTHPRGVDITVPVSVQNHLIQTGPLADPDENGPPGCGMPSNKKRRNPWTKEEDMELIAAVNKCGEGNWANILKGEFKHNRTASQLSQRWAIIRKRQPNPPPSSINKSNNSTWSEETLATRNAISLAVGPLRNLSTVLSGAAQPSTQPSSSNHTVLLSEAQPISAPQAPNQSQPASTPAASKKGPSNHSNKLRAPKKQITPVMPSAIPVTPSATPVMPSALPAVPSAGPSSSIQAVAFAAGGRIANSVTAASLFKAAKSKSAVHIPVRGALAKPLGAGGKPLPGTNTLPPVQNLGTHARYAHPVQKPPRLAPQRPGNQLLRGPAARSAITSPNSSDLAPNRSAHSDTKTSATHMRTTHENAGTKAGRIMNTIDADGLLNKEDGGTDGMDLDHPTGQASLEKNVNILKSGSTVNPQIRGNKTELENTEAAGDQAMVIDTGRIQIPAERGVCLSSKGQGADNESDGKKNAAREQLDCMKVSACETKESRSIVAEQHSDLKCTMPGRKFPDNRKPSVD